MPIDQGLLRGLRGEGQGVFEEKVGGFDRAFYEEKAKGSSRRWPGVFSELNRGRKRRLHPLGEYIITLYTNGKLRTRVMVMLVSRAKEHTPIGVGLRVADSHTGGIGIAPARSLCVDKPFS
ncbi:hypothetical protein Tco_0529607 [Tanacetum coccineum]